jgi:hypothetical protein
MKSAIKARVLVHERPRGQVMREMLTDGMKQLAMLDVISKKLPLHNSRTPSQDGPQNQTESKPETFENIPGPEPRLIPSPFEQVHYR